MSAIGRQTPTLSVTKPSQIPPPGGKVQVKDLNHPSQANGLVTFHEIAERKMRSRQSPPEKANEFEGSLGMLDPQGLFPGVKRESVVHPIPKQVSPSLTEAEACRGASFVDRVLIGHNDTGAEARIRVAFGPIAGTELKIIAGAHGVEASVLSTQENSRRNVEYAMEEMAYRLRRKGYSVQVSEKAKDRQEKPEQEGSEPNER